MGDLIEDIVRFRYNEENNHDSRLLVEHLSHISDIEKKALRQLNHLVEKIDSYTNSIKLNFCFRVFTTYYYNRGIVPAVVYYPFYGDKVDYTLKKNDFLANQGIEPIVISEIVKTKLCKTIISRRNDKDYEISEHHIIRAFLCRENPFEDLTKYSDERFGLIFQNKIKEPKKEVSD